MCGQGRRHTGYGEEEGVGVDVLRGTDTTVSVEDVFTGRETQVGGTYLETVEARMWSASR